MSKMLTDDQEFNDFMTEASLKAMELRQKYDKLSDNNKRRFLLYIEPMVRAGGTQGFMNQMNILFNTGIR
ncbi:MAG: hypothetical protein IJ158_08745 [Treponema sp.]|nr:hypothetical protein [Treponema sp.]